MILTPQQLDSLRKDTQNDLLFLLYRIEDELEYKCNDISTTIDYLQNKK